MELEQGDIVLCTVDRISATTVFVKIKGQEKTGTIVLSEVAPGRIRNLRDYVVPKKTIVCKILKILQDHIELSLRRVTQKEQKELMQQFKIEKSYLSLLKTILKEKTPEIIKKIEEKNTLYNFIEEAKENPSELKKIIGEDSEKILEILKSQKTKIISLKKDIKITTTQPDGLNLIKNLFKDVKNCEIKYISAGKYSIKKEGENLKKIDTELRELLEDLEKKAKENQIEFNIINH